MQTNQATTIVIGNVLDAMDAVNAVAKELVNTREQLWRRSAMIASAKKAEAVVQLKMVAGEAVIFLEYAPDFVKKTIAEQSVCRGEICRKMMKAMDAEDAMFAAAALARAPSAPSAGLAFAGLRQTSETPACGRCPGSSFFEAVLEEVAPKGAVVIVEEDEEAVVIAEEDDEAVVIVEEDEEAVVIVEQDEEAVVIEEEDDEAVAPEGEEAVAPEEAIVVIIVDDDDNERPAKRFCPIF